MSKTRAQYEREGYDEMSARTEWYLSDCPYRSGWRREAWQAGAWKYIQETKAARTLAR